MLKCLSPKTSEWNEFSSTMTSAIICLATNQKFNFLKLIFDSMVSNLDNLSDTEIPQSSGPMEHVADEAVHKERGDSLVRAATTTSSLEAKQASGNITKTRSKATLNEPSSLGTSSGSSLRRQETMGDTISQTRVLNLETTKTTQANEIASLKRRVKKLEKKDRSRTHKLKRLYKVSLSARVESSRYEEDLDALAGEEVFVAEQSEKLVAEPSESTTNKNTNIFKDFIDKGKGNMLLDDVRAKVESDYQLAQRMQAQEQDECSSIESRNKEVGTRKYLNKQRWNKGIKNSRASSLMKHSSMKEEVAINAVPLATKPPTIVDWKIHKKKRKAIIK
ncbi:hypothetical protein Tco_1337239 [Tanacetum coccineum]